MAEALKYTMLVVDDTKMNRNLISRIFKGKYNVLTAENGLVAMETLKSQRVDVIILDILMPEMDGFEVIQAVRADECLKQIPIVITTAEREQFERKALQLGADDFVTKPFDPMVVAKRVDNITQRYALEMEKMQLLVREHEARAEALRRRAEEDGLTKIYNRIGFRNNVNELLARGTNESALMIIDIDEFKTVNDKYGHPAGDALLQRLAAYFEGATLPEDVVGRIGGDEFAVFLCTAGSRQSVIRKANTFIRQAARIRRELGMAEDYSISVGIVYSEKDGKKLDELYKIADNALYLAKKNGKSCASMLERLETDSGAHIDLSCSPALYSAAETGLGNERTSAENGANGAVLILDSSEISRAALRQILQARYPVYEAANGNLAIEMLSSVSDSIHLVILRLHDAQGSESAFMRLLTEHEALADIPVMAIADDLTERGEAELFSLGVVGVLKKEDRQDVILQCIDLVMRKRAQELLRRRRRLLGESGESQQIVDMDVFRLEQRESDGKLYLDACFEDYIAGDWSKFSFADPSAVFKYVYAPDIPKFTEFLEQGAETGYASAEIRLIAASGVFEWFRLCFSRVQAAGETRGVLTFINIDKEIAAKELLEKQSRSVLLTQLPNLNSFSDEVYHLLAANPDRDFALIQFDVERFRLINSLFGAQEGDNILRYIGAKLREFMENSRAIGCCCHIHSDIFAVCVQAGETSAGDLAAFLQNAMSGYPLRFRVTLAFGIYEIEDRTSSVNEMLSRARAARQTIKGGERHIARYGPETRELDAQKSTIILEMQSALKNGQFEPFLQPCCDVSTGGIVGAEALVRWRRGEGGLELPEAFIPAFESNGFISEIDRHMLKSICSFIQTRHEKGLPIEPISVNLSRTDIYAPSLADDIEQIAQRCGVRRGELSFELSERVFLNDKLAVTRAIRNLRQKDFAVAMDCFGGDVGSLNLLRDAGVETIKLDARLVRGAAAERKNEEIIYSLAALSEALQIDVVAVGVESRKQAEFLKTIGMSRAQGFFYYKPMPALEFETFING